MKTSTLVVGWILALLTSSCGSDDQSAGEKPSGAVCPPDSTLTYASFGQAFMTSYCVRCHSSTLAGSARNDAPSDFDFDTLALIRASRVEEIDGVAAAGPEATNDEMPPSDPLPTLAERQDLGEWLACGAP